MESGRGYTRGVEQCDMTSSDGIPSYSFDRTWSSRGMCEVS